MYLNADVRTLEYTLKTEKLREIFHLKWEYSGMAGNLWNAKLCLNHIKGGASRFHAVKSKTFFNILKTNKSDFLRFFNRVCVFVCICICMRMCISLKFIQKYYSNKYQYKSTPLTEHIRRIIKTNILHIFISDK